MTIEQLYQHFEKYLSVSTDTRNIKEGDIFFALKGERFNGNKYAKKAYENGASLVVVDEEVDVPLEKACQVKNALETLQALANYHRKQSNFKVIAITGSNGKTTTKELVHSVLAKQYNVKSTPGNFNNHIGVPLTLLGIPKHTEFAIIEMGDNHSGEIAELCKIAEPDFGLITNVGKDHLEGFGSMEANIAAKGELFDYLQMHNGIGLVNTDDEVVNKLAQVLKNKVEYNENTAPYLKAINPFIELENINGKVTRTQLIGLYNLENIRIAWQIGKYFAINDVVISEAIQEYQPKNNRSQIVNTTTNTIILDAYNANPSSVEVALESFHKTEFNQVKVVILGDMLELGFISEQEHINMVKLVDGYKFNRCIFCGELYKKHENDKYEFYTNKKALIEHLKTNSIKNAAVLLKGSRGMSLESLVDFL